jgi:hypothetical protein
MAVNQLILLMLTNLRRLKPRSKKKTTRMQRRKRSSHKNLQMRTPQNLKMLLLLGHYTSLLSANVSKKKTHLLNSPNASSYVELHGALWTRQPENLGLTSLQKRKKMLKNTKLTLHPKGISP